MKIRIYEFPNSQTPPYLKEATPVERGYIEIPDDKVSEYGADKCWDICNWSHWADAEKPECLHSDVDHCDHGIVFVYPGVEFEIHCMALSSGWFIGREAEIKRYVERHINDVMWNDDRDAHINYTECLMQSSIKVGRVYRHFKGNNYLVLDIAKHSETGESYVVYKALYGDCQTYIRPYSMFASKVDIEKYPNVTQKFRFELVEDKKNDNN